MAVGSADEHRKIARALLLPVAGLVFLASFWLLRQAFKRRSGGLGFR